MISEYARSEFTLLKYYLFTTEIWGIMQQNNSASASNEKRDTQNKRIQASIADDIVVIIIIQSITTGNFGRFACESHVVESDVE